MSEPVELRAARELVDEAVERDCLAFLLYGKTDIVPITRADLERRIEELTTD